MENIITEKRCTKCGELKDISNFVKDPQKNDGFYSSCKQCYQIRRNQNRDADIKRCKDYKLKNRESLLEKKRKKWWDNRDENLQKLSEYHIKNKDKEIVYRENNKEKLRLSGKLWKLLNKERCAASVRKWRAENPGKVSVQKNNRRAREKNGGKIKNEEWQEVLERYGNKCLCCGRNDVRITMDHVVPLSAGGLNVIENTQPLCRSCNSRKNSKTIDYR